MKPRSFDYCRPETIDDALRILADADDARILSGGQSLGPMLNLRLAVPALLIDISRVAELREMSETADSIRYGAATRHAQFEDGEVADAGAGMLAYVAGQIAYRAVRNRGTLGGSLAHADPAGDWAPTMIALDAHIHIRSNGGNRIVPTSDLIPDVMSTVLEDDEMIVAIDVPRLSRGARWGYYKITRQPGHFGDSIAAVVIDPQRESVRVALALKRLPPVTLAETAALLANANAWSPETGREIKETVQRELHGLSIDLDSYEAAIHPIAVARAAERALPR